jgi:basic membrane protein A
VQREIEIAQRKEKRMLEYKIDASIHTIFFKHIFNGIKWIDGTDNPIGSVEQVKKYLINEKEIIKSEKKKNTPFVSKGIVKFTSIGLIFAIIIISSIQIILNNLNQRELDILFITNGDPLFDGEVNEAIWTGIHDYTNNRSIIVDFYQPKEYTLDEYMRAIDLASRKGVRIIVAHGILVEEVFGVAQDRYPNIQFILLNGTPRTGPNLLTKTIRENTSAVIFNPAHAGFLAGYSAVIEGYYSLGYMGAFPIREYVDFGIGFIAGAYYGAYRKNVQIDFPDNRYTYLNNLDSTTSIYNLALDWYENDTDLIVHFSQGHLENILNAAEESSGMLITTISDVTHLSDNILTSVFNDYSEVIKVLLFVYFNNLTLTTGREVSYGLPERAVMINVETSNFINFNEAHLSELIELYNQGRFEIPQNQTELRRFINLLGYDLDIRPNNINRPINP